MDINRGARALVRNVAAVNRPKSENKHIRVRRLVRDNTLTERFSGGGSDAEQRAELEARTLALCANMREQNVRIGTVTFEAPVAAQMLLEACAATPGNDFNATDSAKLNAAFQSIADNLRTLRVTQ